MYEPDHVVTDKAVEDRLDSEEDMGEERWRRGEVERERENAETFHFRLQLGLFIFIIVIIRVVNIHSAY